MAAAALDQPLTPNIVIGRRRPRDKWINNGWDGQGVSEHLNFAPRSHPGPAGDVPNAEPEGAGAQPIIVRPKDEHGRYTTVDIRSFIGLEEAVADVVRRVAPPADDTHVVIHVFGTGHSFSRLDLVDGSDDRGDAREVEMILGLPSLPSNKQDKQWRAAVTAGPGAADAVIKRGENFRGALDYVIGEFGQPAQRYFKTVTRYGEATNEQLDSYLFRVAASVTLHELNEVLAPANRALLNMGQIDSQTVAGAVSTGTHGSGLAYPPISAFAVSIDMVDPFGRRVRVEPERGITESAPSGVLLVQNNQAFHAARVGLGTMGIITHVVLLTVPRFQLWEKRVLVRMRDMFAPADPPARRRVGQQGVVGGGPIDGAPEGGEKDVKVPFLHNLIQHVPFVEFLIDPYGPVGCSLNVCCSHTCCGIRDCGRGLSNICGCRCCCGGRDRVAYKGIADDLTTDLLDDTSAILILRGHIANPGEPLDELTLAEVEDYLGGAGILSDSWQQLCTHGATAFCTLSGTYGCPGACCFGCEVLLRKCCAREYFRCLEGCFDTTDYMCCLNCSCSSAPPTTGVTGACGACYSHKTNYRSLGQVCFNGRSSKLCNALGPNYIGNALNFLCCCLPRWCLCSLQACEILAMADNMYQEDSPLVFMNDEPIRMAMLSSETAVPITRADPFLYIDKLRETLHVFRESAACSNGCSHTNLPMVVRFIHPSRDYLSVAYGNPTRRDPGEEEPVTGLGPLLGNGGGELLGFCLIEAPTQPRTFDHVGMYLVMQDVEANLVTSQPSLLPGIHGLGDLRAAAARRRDAREETPVAVGQTHFGKLQMRGRSDPAPQRRNWCVQPPCSRRNGVTVTDSSRADQSYADCVRKSMRVSDFRAAAVEFSAAVNREDAARAQHPADAHANGVYGGGGAAAQDPPLLQPRRESPIRLRTPFTDKWGITEPLPFRPIIHGDGTFTL